VNAETIKQSLDYGTYYRSELESLTNGRGDDAKALCPFHEDKEPSLSINLKSGLFKCFGCNAQGDVFHFYQKKHGCDFQAAVNELGNFAGLNAGNGKRATKSHDKIIAVYDYHDAGGKVIFQTVRFDPKDFRQRRPNGKSGWIDEIKSLPELVPYRLPELLKADTVYIPEGEKDCLALAKYGLAASCNPMGAGKWRTEYNNHFKGKRVVILPDNDQAGRDHAQDVARNLHGIAASVKVVELPGLLEKGDVSDWLESGGTPFQLLQLANVAPEFSLFPEVISAADLEHIVFPEISYIVKDIMPEGFGLLTARPKKGKSFLALNVSVAVATGGCALGKKDLRVDPGKALCIAYEDKNRRIKNRLKTIMQGDPFPQKLFVVESWPRFSDGGLDRLDHWLRVNPDTRLVVIDTLGRFKPRKKAKEEAYEADLATGAALADLAHRHNISLLGIFHNRKAESEDPLDDVYGSTGLTAAADFVMVLKRGRGQADAELFITGRDIEENTLALKFHQDDGIWELMGTADEVAKSQARQKIVSLLRDNGSLSAKDISDFLGKKEATIRKLLWNMKNDFEIKYKDGKYSVY
jgi:AAA domain/CHC2 zinc finger/Toprim-like